MQAGAWSSRYVPPSVTFRMLVKLLNFYNYLYTAVYCVLRLLKQGGYNLARGCRHSQ